MVSSRTCSGDDVWIVVVACHGVVVRVVAIVEGENAKTPVGPLLTWTATTRIQTCVTHIVADDDDDVDDDDTDKRRLLRARFPVRLYVVGGPDEADTIFLLYALCPVF